MLYTRRRGFETYFGEEENKNEDRRENIKEMGVPVSFFSEKKAEKAPLEA